MHGQLGMISGYQIFEQNMLTKTVLIKKQKRKLKNKRWVKKYKKKYSKEVPRTDFLIDHINKRIYSHPSRIDWLRKQFDKPDPNASVLEKAIKELERAGKPPVPNTVQEIRMRREEGYNILNRFMVGVRTKGMFDFSTIA